jgi:hypothetical protein
MQPAALKLGNYHQVTKVTEHRHPLQFVQPMKMNKTFSMYRSIPPLFLLSLFYCSFLHDTTNAVFFNASVIARTYNHSKADRESGLGKRNAICVYHYGYVLVSVRHHSN